MDNIIEHKAIILIIAFIILFGLEKLIPYVKQKRSLENFTKNLLFIPINITCSLAIILPITYAASEIPLWQNPGSLLLDIIILDLFIFWWHHSMHEIPFLWRFHEVHHLDENLDTSSALRFHFGETIASSLVRACVIIIFAIPFSSVIIFELLVTICALFHHSNIKIPKKLELALSKIIITPSIHWIHHHAIRKDTDSNYGTIFSFWDKLFSTSSRTVRSKNMKIGVENVHDKKIIALLAKPFKSI